MQQDCSLRSRQMSFTFSECPMVRSIPLSAQSSHPNTPSSKKFGASSIGKGKTKESNFSSSQKRSTSMQKNKQNLFLANSSQVSQNKQSALSFSFNPLKNSEGRYLSSSGTSQQSSAHSSCCSSLRNSSLRMPDSPNNSANFQKLFNFKKDKSDSQFSKYSLFKQAHSPGDQNNLTGNRKSKGKKKVVLRKKDEFETIKDISRPLNPFSSQKQNGLQSTRRLPSKQRQKVNCRSSTEEFSPQNSYSCHSKGFFEENISVSVRLRPTQTQLELKSQSNPHSQPSTLIKASNGQMVLLKDKFFAFDRVFQSEDQMDIFEEVAAPIIDKVFEGFNGTIFAYGQTGSGKTHTIYGKSSSEDRGLIPRSIEKIFEKISTEQLRDSVSVKCSLVQVYKQELIDLLRPGTKNLKVKENSSQGVYIENLSEVEAICGHSLLKQIEEALKCRKTSATKLNEASSRSHTILTLVLEFPDFSSKLSLIDLAGSEKVRKSGVVGESFEEMKKINYSLSCLGNVINALTTRSTTDHIPFRDCKLTRILKDSLSGKFLTSIIVTCSVEPESLDETLSSLKFAERAKRVKVLPENMAECAKMQSSGCSYGCSSESSTVPNTSKNERGSVELYQMKIRELTKELNSTKNELNFYKMKESLGESTQSQQACSFENDQRKQQLAKDVQSKKSSIITDSLENRCPQNSYRSTFSENETGDNTARMPIPSERANVAEKYSKYADRGVVPCFMKSKRSSVAKLQCQQIGSQLRHSEALPKMPEQESLELNFPRTEMVSLNVSNTFCGEEDGQVAPRPTPEGKSDLSLTDMSVSEIEPQFEQKEEELASESDPYSSFRYQEASLKRFNPAVLANPSKNGSYGQRRLPMSAQRDSEISFSFSLYRDEDMMNSGRLTAKSTKRSLLR